MSLATDYASERVEAEKSRLVLVIQNEIHKAKENQSEQKRERSVSTQPFARAHKIRSGQVRYNTMCNRSLEH